jgi:hypothetical protein
MQAAHLLDNILVKGNVKHPAISLFSRNSTTKEYLVK